MSPDKNTNTARWFEVTVAILIVVALIYISQLTTGPKADTYDVKVPATDIGKTNPDPVS